MKRRTFLRGTLQLGAVLPLASSGLFARPLRSFPFARAAAAQDRVLVLINLNGGNDGLNTVVPIADSRYYDARTVLGVKDVDTFHIAPDAGLTRVIPEINALYGDGHCAIVQNVGYANPDRSHFRSTDIWHSASDSNQVIQTGWTGRYLETIHPEYPNTLPSSPFAVQVSNSTTLLIQGSRGSMGMAIDSPDRFFDLANGLTVSNDPLPQTLAGPQIDYIRRIIVEADAYSTAINLAITNGHNYVTYGAGTLSQQLQGVARLIDGGLGTTIYVVTLSGFDTHYKQPDQHKMLLTEFSVAVKTFLDDIAAAGKQDKVVCMSYSEFGRRLAENNAAGTDHGAAAPQFVFGAPVLGGKMLGPMPDLGDLDARGDVKMKIDYRQLYATLLEDWLGFSHQDTVAVLGSAFEKLPLFAPAGVDDAHTVAGDSAIRFESISPNPASASTTITFTIARAGVVRCRVIDERGTVVAVPVEHTLEAGTHAVSVDVRGLPAGSYLVVLDPKGTVVKRLNVVR